MTVDAAAQRFHRIVEVHPSQVLQSDYLVQFGERGVAGRCCAQVVSCGERVAGVDAESDARFVLHTVDDVTQVLETVAEVRTLSGRVLDDGRHAVGLLQCHVDGGGDAVERCFLADFLQVAARMEIQSVEPQGLATLHLVDERFARFGEPVGFGMPEIDEVGIMGQDAGRCISGRSAGLFERDDLLLGQLLGKPLTLVFREKGEPCGSDFTGA